MKNFYSCLLVLTAMLFLASYSFAQSAKAKDTADKKWEFESTPSWSDEFDKNGLPDSTKWSYDTGGNGWGNNELEYYTKGKNAIIKNGILQIEARKEKIGNNNYSSVRMVTKNKGDFLYGRFEVRAKLPTGRGLWPAIWMLPTDWKYGGWPASGEIDIMEQVGYDPENIHITMHTKDYNHTIHTQKTSITRIPTATSAFHVYRVDWTPAYIQGFIDGVQVYEFKNEGKGFATWPFDQRFHFLLNIAVGGNWGGAKGVDDSVFPAKMEVDYVRVYPLKQE